MDFSFSLLGGVLIGIVMGSLGAGGSLLTVPALIVFLHQSPAAAGTGSLIIVSSTALITGVSYFRRGQVHWAHVWRFIVVGAAPLMVGSYLAHNTSKTLMLWGFATVLLAAAVLLVVGTLLPENQHTLPSPLWSMRLVTAAAVSGFLTGLFGVGGGFLIVPALIGFLGYSAQRAAGTSLMIMAFMSVGALLARAGVRPHPDWLILFEFSLAAVFGSLLASWWAKRLSSRTLTRIFAGFLVVIACYTAFLAAGGGGT